MIVKDWLGYRLYRFLILQIEFIFFMLTVSGSIGSLLQSNCSRGGGRGKKLTHSAKVAS
uniref:Unkown protein n=1 Tax=Riptortus pedestris TaxID=329032 RepID=R4WTZ1_RIPPE|nr:unkown protein [Riptortus pedestris]